MDYKLIAMKNSIQPGELRPEDKRNMVSGTRVETRLGQAVLHPPEFPVIAPTMLPTTPMIPHLGFRYSVALPTLVLVTRPASLNFRRR